jgi:hypothetical protein
MEGVRWRIGKNFPLISWKISPGDEHGQRMGGPWLPRELFQCPLLISIELQKEQRATFGELQAANTIIPLAAHRNTKSCPKPVVEPITTTTWSWKMWNISVHSALYIYSIPFGITLSLQYTHICQSYNLSSQIRLKEVINQSPHNLHKNIESKSPTQQTVEHV